MIRTEETGFCFHLCFLCLIHRGLVYIFQKPVAFQDSRISRAPSVGYPGVGRAGAAVSQAGIAFPVILAVCVVRNGIHIEDLVIIIPTAVYTVQGCLGISFGRP
ncbi:hypothetical protein D3C73_877670 [compost metagenome]